MTGEPLPQVEVSIPLSLLTNPNVSSIAVRLYGVIIALTCPASEVYGGHRVACAVPGAELRDVSQQALAVACGVRDTRTIGKATEDLVELGYISVRRAETFTRAGLKKATGWRETPGHPDIYKLLPLPQ